tara:strand:- start:640 stop:1290 length:651 start_codon:yes stop_codon:yes gene_type:complete
MVSTTNYHYKKNNSANVAICVPVQNQVTAVFAYSLAMLQRKCGEAELATSLHFNMGSEVTMQRQQLVEQALETDCTHIMWIDADMQFPVDTLNILLAADKDIIAGNYSTRVPPHRPVAFKSKNNLDSRVFSGKGIEKVWAVGSGMMLVKREVYENVSPPHYKIEYSEDYTNLVGEDIYFCNLVNKDGYEVYISHDLSDRIAHIGTRAYTVKDDCND